MSPRDYSFQERMAMSTGIATSSRVGDILLANIPAAVAVERAQPADDRTGTDYWVFRGNGLRPLSVDLKTRKDDPIEKHWGDDLALEVWSVKGTGKAGWTLDETKRADYILWFFIPTGRWVLIPFPFLLAVFRTNKDKWVSLYKTKPQTSDNKKWESECVFVPRDEVWSEIYRMFGGSLIKPQAPENGRKEQP